MRKRELTYRIFLQELPPPPSPDFNGTKMLMRVSLPVFVLPKVAAKPLLRWQAVRTSDGSLKISLTNDGNAHIQIINFSLSKPGSAQPWISQKASDYASNWTELGLDPAGQCRLLHTAVGYYHSAFSRDRCR